MVTEVIIWLLIVGTIVLLVLAIVNGWFSSKGAGPASLTAFHDLQPKNKQKSIEVIIEEKAGRNQFEQTSGDMNDPQSERPSRGNLRSAKGGKQR